MQSSKLYVCYSLPLRDYLMKNGLRWEVSGRHMETHNPFWAFMKSNKLKELLNTWSQGE